jgi:hypothetical protein
VTKETVVLTQDHPLPNHVLLASGYTIHGAETGIKPNEIFAVYLPLGQTLGKYARNFGQFSVLPLGNRTILVPLVNDVPDVSDIVTDPDSFAEEASFLAKLSLSRKIILSTHRTKHMTIESHRAVCQILLDQIWRLSVILDSGEQCRVEGLMDTINECTDELVKKSSDYPAQLDFVKNALLVSHDRVGQALASTIQPHCNELGSLPERSMVILRASHLLRSALHRAHLYGRPSESVTREQAKLLKACNIAGIPLPIIPQDGHQIHIVLEFLRGMTQSCIDVMHAVE